MTTVALAGSTGLVHLLRLRLRPPRPPNPTASPKLFHIPSAETDQWPAQFPKESKPAIFFSGLGTTRGAAGSVDAQRKIDLDLNLALCAPRKTRA
ncbi:Protein fmp52, mitochondrial [Didymosphaeria variabile]|uniref:Protein fmp52, mitochondrial n=1 Tax=Didymosphaeria variabile TaxID=1932322 RepID=A0A9W9C873_9PLEO|nr:Protein fmp52, mitochondrial [Didymosphaeria variabile]KAJ4349491.1 Protein fmp52, mitochondrial [Didymosphaeria variabile]